MKQGILVITAYPMVESDRAQSGLLKTVFKLSWASKMTRFDSNHMCGGNSVWVGRGLNSS